MEHDEVIGFVDRATSSSNCLAASAPMTNSRSSVSTKRMALATACRVASSLTPWRRADRMILVCCFVPHYQEMRVARSHYG